MGSTDQFNIRWNNYTSVLQNVFRKLLEGEQFVDVTLACEGQSIKCHRLILSACSTYFDRILTDNPTSNLVIYLKDMKFWELRALVTFMYNGEVSISQQKLPHLCKAAEALKIKGLAHDTGLTDGDLDRMDDDEVDDFHVSEEVYPVETPRAGSLHVQQQPKSLLRQQHSTLSAFAAAAASNRQQQQPQQIKRKILTQPPKLVKMQRIDANRNGGGNVKPQQQTSPLNKVAAKKPEPELNRSVPKKETYQQEEEIDNGYSNEGTADSSVKEDGETVADVEENEEIEGVEEVEAGGSEGEEVPQGNAGRPNKVMKYGKEVRDSALTALQSGMTLRQCSETYGIPRKTIAKWKNRDAKNEGEEAEGSSPKRTTQAVTPTNASSGIVLPPKTTMGAPVDSADRAERLRKATELALSGVTVRQAAAHYEIPRTTLCAYMKRRGLAAKKNFVPNGNGNNSAKRAPSKSSDNNGETNGQTQAGGNSSHYEDFPFLGISELMDEMGQGGYEADGYADGEEEFSEK